MSNFKERFNIDLKQLEEPEETGISTARYLAAMVQERLPADSIITPEMIATLKEWVWKEQLHANGSVSVAEAFYGKRYSGTEEVLGRIIEITGSDNIPDIFSDSGFKELYQVSPGLTGEQYLFTAMLAANELVRQSVEAIGGGRPELFLTATSIPPMEGFEKRLAQAAGLENLDAAPHAHLRACESSGAALWDVTTGRYDELLWKLYGDKLKRNEPIIVTIFAYEDAHRLLGMGGDVVSGQLFSTAATAMSFRYHPDARVRSTFTHVLGDRREVKRGAECLRYFNPVKDWDPEFHDQKNLAPHLTEPDDGMAVQMDPGRTGAFFKNHAIKLATSVMEKFRHHLENQNDPMTKEQVAASIKRVIVHHPSSTVFKHLKSAMTGKGDHARRYGEGLGFEEGQIQWVITEGNAPSTTIPIALGRQLQDIEDGDLLMFLSFGAGGGFTCQIVQVNL